MGGRERAMRQSRRREITAALATSAALLVFAAMLWATPDQGASCEVYCGPLTLLGAEALLILAPIVCVVAAAFVVVQAIRKGCNRVVLVICGTLLLVPPAIMLNMYLASR
jgi:hypothetical protein